MDKCSCTHVACFRYTVLANIWIELSNCKLLDKNNKNKNNKNNSLFCYSLVSYLSGVFIAH